MEQKPRRLSRSALYILIGLVVVVVVGISALTAQGKESRAANQQQATMPTTQADAQGITPVSAPPVDPSLGPEACPYLQSEKGGKTMGAALPAATADKAAPADSAGKSDAASSAAKAGVCPVTGGTKEDLQAASASPNTREEVAMPPASMDMGSGSSGMTLKAAIPQKGTAPKKAAASPSKTN